ncbi:MULTISPECIES: phage head-tail connector protein [Hyphomicrobiales]|uniref:head-tail connector protein n=1 Tax=Hyphomicrobiales TaxID=356 RepID=UPI001BD01D0F|nr:MULTISPECIES: phage head-tail connector protein [Hyphomicrobiales]MBS7741483.1 phage head-tail connector protein [Chelatococcus sp. HY11]MBX3491206.1 phage head-tail connector protein [Parvibaculum sp.]MBX3544498.1 phage head-tail connector protein [Chelatococcus sp.]MCO5078979.1 phage head-tail connector protein [Chelatococcus sp.]
MKAMDGLTLLTPPSGEVVGIDEIKAHLDIKNDARADLLASLAKAATASLDGIGGLLGRALLPQRWRLDLDCFPCEIILPLPPIKAVESVSYVPPSGGINATLPTSEYQVIGSDKARIIPAFGHQWPATRCYPASVSVTFECGYADAAAVPEPIREAILLMVGQLYLLADKSADMRSSEIDGVGKWEYLDPRTVSNMSRDIVNSLLMPYRQMAF